MDIQTSKQGEVALVIISGELSQECVEDLKGYMDAALKIASKIVVDLAGVPAISSNCIGILVGALKDAKDVGGDIRLASLSGSVLQVFELTKLDKVFEIRGTAEEAVDSFN